MMHLIDLGRAYNSHVVSVMMKFIFDAMAVEGDGSVTRRQHFASGEK